MTERLNRRDPRILGEPLGDLRERRIRDSGGGGDLAPLAFASVQDFANLAKGIGDDGLIHIRIMNDPHRDCKARQNPTMDQALTQGREILARNLWAMMNRPGRPSIGHQELARIARKISPNTLSQSSVSRILKCETSVGLDQLALLARVFDVEPWQLLVPGMNPDDPPVLTSTTKMLEEFQATLKQQADQIAALRDGLKRK
jgi:transcriptional regulator with XRE-family HTH domain